MISARINHRRDNIDVTRMPPGLDRMAAGEQSEDTIEAGGVFAAGERAAIPAKTASDASGKI